MTFRQRPSLLGISVAGALAVGCSRTSLFPLAPPDHPLDGAPAPSDADSFFVSMDGATEDAYHTAEGRWSTAWQWTFVETNVGGCYAIDVVGRLFSLTAGDHTLRFRAREGHSTLDAVRIVDDIMWVPEWLGPLLLTPARGDLREFRHLFS